MSRLGTLAGSISSLTDAKRTVGDPSTLFVSSPDWIWWSEPGSRRFVRKVFRLAHWHGMVWRNGRRLNSKRLLTNRGLWGLILLVDSRHIGGEGGSAIDPR